MIRNIINYSLGQLVTQAMMMLKGFVIAKLLGPRLFGTWSALALVLTYGMSVHLGMLDGMNKLVPFFRGKGEAEHAEVLKNTAFTSTMLFSAMFLFLVVGIDVFTMTDSSRAERIGIVMVAGGVGLYQWYNFQLGLRRFKYDFTSVRNAQTLVALTDSILAIGLSVYLGIYALFIALPTSYLIANVYLMRGRQESFCLRIGRREVGVLLRTGVPLILSGLAFTLITTVDRLMIIRFLSRQELGYYALGTSFGVLSSFLPTMAASVVYIRMLEGYGERRCMRDIERYLSGPVVIFAAVIPALIGVLLSFTDLIYFILPKYVNGLPAMRILISGSFFLGIAATANIFLVTINRERRILAVQCLLIPLCAVANYVLIGLGLGLEGVAWATFLTYFLYGSTLLAMAYGELRDVVTDGLKQIGKTYLPYVCVIGVFLLTQRVMGNQTAGLWGALGVATLKGAILVGCSVPFLWRANVETGVLTKTFEAARSMVVIRQTRKTV